MLHPMVKSGSEPVKAGESPVHGRRASTVAAFGGNQAALRRLSSTPPRIQPKLEVGAANDPLEVQADQVANHVMRQVDDEEASAIAADLPSGAQDQQQVQTKGEGVNAAARPAPPIVKTALRASGAPLDAATRGFFEPRFNRSFEDVRIHTDSLAAASARAIGARAYTLGNRIAFASGRFAPATPQGCFLLAHELAHVVQQNQAIRRADGDDAGGGTPGKQVVDALTQKDEIAGVGDTGKALTILKGLDTDGLISALLEVDNAALIDVLVSVLAPGDQSELASAICAVRFTSSNGQPDDEFGVRAAKGIAQLGKVDQDKLIGMVLQRKGSTATVEEVREGADALMESETTRQAEPEVDAGTVTTMMAGISMLPWNPGRMPIPYYIGNAAHVAIAAAYAALHSTDAAFYNFTPVSSILLAAAALGIKVNPAVATAAQLGLKPDIANLTKLQLYEIKPLRLQTVAKVEAALYLAAFAAAGVPMLPGPTTEPGTFGTLPAPGGWFVYSAPEPGVITYAYRQPPRKKPANDNATQPATAPALDKSLVEKIAAITGLSGVALWIYIILSEGSRVAFPPRNAIPIP